jgi:IclR family pca regulon transcriptional regulator
MAAGIRTRSRTRHSQRFVTAFARGLSLIEAFGPEHTRMSVAEAAQRVGRDRAVTRRLLHTLVELGFARADGRQFELTPKVLRLGYSFLASLGLDSTLKPYLDALSREIEESVSVSVLEGNEVVFVARSEQPGRRVAFVVAMGMRLPAFSAASGRVLLAAMLDREVEALLKATKIEKLTRHTVVNRREVLRIIRQVRGDGYAINREELEEGLVGVSVPLSNRGGRVVAALNASANAARHSDERLVRAIVPRLAAAAMRLSDVVL